MSLEALYADSIEQGLQRWAANPGPEPKPSFSLTSFLGAGAKGLPSAALESGGSVADVLSGFGTALAASGGSAGGMFSLPTPAEQKQEAQARDRMLKGDAFDVTAGNAMREQAQAFAPDPLTTHAADQVMHGLVRFGAKAVADVGTMGPAGAILLGLDEGNTVTQNLRTEGIDTATAAKVGAVQGAVAGASAVIPLGGRTIAQTIGLVGIGGPGSYMAQEHLSRRILENAGYNDQASLHNPFDPLGLALSTIIPGGFGALHMRGEFRRAEGVSAGTVPLQQLRPEELRSLKYDDPRLDAYASQAAEAHGVPPALLLAIKNAGEKSGPTAVSGKGAQGVMQFMPGTAKEMGLADRTDPVASIDAGARYMRKLYDAYGSWDAAVAHYNGGGAQAAIVRGGGKPTAKETIGYLDRVQQYVAQHTAQEAAQHPEAVDAARVAALNDTVQRSLPDTPDAMAQVQRAADIIGESGGRQAEQEIAPLREPSPFTEAQVEDSNRNQVPGLRAEFDNGQGGRGVMELAIDGDRLHPTWVDNGLTGVSANPRTGGAVTRLYEQAIQEAADRGMRFTSDDSVTEGAARVYEALQRRGYEVEKNPAARLATQPEVVTPRWVTDNGSPVFEVKGAPENAAAARTPRASDDSAALAPRQREADNALPPHDSVTLAGDQPTKPGQEMTKPVAKAGESSQPGTASSEATKAGSGETPSLDTVLAEKLATEQPGLQVVLPGSDERVTVAEAMKRIADEQKQDLQWGELVRVAAECALAAG